MIKYTAVEAYLLAIHHISKLILSEEAKVSGTKELFTLYVRALRTVHYALKTDRAMTKLKRSQEKLNDHLDIVAFVAKLDSNL